MKRNLYYGFLLFMLMTVASCTPLLKIYYGIHKPRLESPASIIKYAERKKLNEGIVLVAKDSASYFYLLQYLKKGPDLFLFSRNGTALKYNVNETCNAPVYDFTETICQGNYSVSDSLVNVSSLLDRLKPLTSGDSIRFLESKTKDVKYYTFITWGKFGGYLNEDHVRPWLTSLNKQKDCLVNTYLVNIDFNSGFMTKEQFKYYNFNTTKN